MDGCINCEVERVELQEEIDSLKKKIRTLKLDCKFFGWAKDDIEKHANLKKQLEELNNELS